MVTVCAVSGATGDRTRVGANAAARGDGCDEAAAARRAARPHDRAELGRDQAAALLADLRGTLLKRFGTSDERRLDASLRRARRPVVPVRFHVVHSGRTGRVPASLVHRQISILNAAYGGGRGGADTGVRFHLASIDWTNSAAWFRSPQRYGRPMKKRLRKGGRGTLNVFTAAVGTDVLGYSTFPQWYRRNPGLDGVVIDHRSLPRGSGPFDRGYTAVHEIGHWLGLLHTFQGGCTPPGDGVADTPYEAEPAEGCPAHRDTCPQRGSDPVHNFMDYGHDSCMSEFTAGQGRRIRAAWAVYRSGGRGHRHVDLGTRAAGSARSVGGAR